MITPFFMQKIYPCPLRNDFIANVIRFLRQRLCAVSILTILLSFTTLHTYASHFRGGTVTWTRVSETSTHITIRLNVSLSWRNGAAPTIVDFFASGGNVGRYPVQMTNSLDATGLWT